MAEKNLVNRPLVSIIIPSFNSGEFVVSAVESALHQTYRAREIIVVDDGSTDDTRQKLDPFLRAHSVRYHYQPNGGLSAARNAGLEISGGKYIQFLDADDLLEATKIEKQVAQLETATQTSIAGCDFRCFDDDDPATLYGGDPFKGEFPLRDTARLFDFHTVIHRWLFPAGLLREVGLFESQLPATEDWLMLWKIATTETPFVYVDEPLVRYRKHGNGMTSDYERLAAGHLMAIDCVDSFQRQNGLSLYSPRDLNRMREPFHYELALHFLRSNRKLRAWREVIKAFALSSNRRQIKLLLLAATPALGTRAIDWVASADERLWQWRLQLRKRFVG